MKKYCPERAINGYSCALACLVSVCKENNLQVKQNDLIEKYKKDYPAWDQAPGLLDDKQILCLAEKIGLASQEKSEIKEKPSKDFLQQQCKDPNTSGILIGTHKGGMHCYKFIETMDEDKFKLMNPSTYDQQEESHTWKELEAMDIKIIILKK